ncbi:CAZyme family GT71 [Paecilomyces variotii]|nr:CAZyme family GT71 [Paecilomyces variotii]KAJ9242714.1 CAZyme family GT71 [Paecilomyces variotii]KAJ9266487.1 CAZyme family GT71 [Paecilomyces variotii]KAJ9368745.1 CAZyme family GT71 [Paecilomyces variotii]
MMARLPTRLRTVLVAFILASIFSWFLSRHRHLSNVNEVKWSELPAYEASESHETKDGLKDEIKDQSKHEIEHNVRGHMKFWREFQPLLMEYAPDCDSPHKLGTAPGVRFDAKNPGERPELVEMLVDDVIKMRTAHTNFVNAIRDGAPSLHYTPGTRGLVSTAGGSYLPVLVISLRMLRKTGSKLPMEVFLADADEHEEYICDVVLPSLNAKCVILSDILSAAPEDMQIEKYQFKPFAMLFSSFEEILFLDADAFPIDKPEVLFDNEPFQSKHMVTWPDFWASSASPLFYAIASQEIPPMDVRQSTESGEVVVSKKTHAHTLLLCTYYNYWGPSHFYSLLSQGAPGEGDKETFLAAATAMNEPFYQVSEPIRAIGHPSSNGFAGSAMVQFHPLEDYQLTQKGEWRVNGSKAPSPKPFFIHANFPKFNPATVFDKQMVNPAYDDDGGYTRAWTDPEDTVSDFGHDVEREFWNEIMWTACELEHRFRSWRNEKDVCSDVKKYWKAIFANGKDSAV